jgi:hypothetical protein
MKLYVEIYDEEFGGKICWKSFNRKEEAEQYMKDANELNGIRAELKVKV